MMVLFDDACDAMRLNVEMSLTEADHAISALSFLRRASGSGRFQFFLP